MAFSVSFRVGKPHLLHFQPTYKVGPEPSYKWSYNLPYKWVTGAITLINGVMGTYL